MFFINLLVSIVDDSHKDDGCVVAVAAGIDSCPTGGLGALLAQSPPRCCYPNPRPTNTGYVVVSGGAGAIPIWIVCGIGSIPFLRLRVAVFALHPCASFCPTSRHCERHVGFEPRNTILEIPGSPWEHCRVL